MTNYAQQVEDALDLKKQIGVLEDVSEADMMFRDTSPPARWETVYSMQTGEPLRVKRHRLLLILQKTLPNGSRAFTSRQEDAPTYELGTVKCFLARGSEERAVVDELNISPGYYCIAEHLANEMAATLHAEKKHPTRWRLYHGYLERKEREEDRAMQRAQMEAMMKLAGSRAAPATTDFTCETCGFTAKSAFGLKAHQRGKHTGVEG